MIAPFRSGSPRIGSPALTSANADITSCVFCIDAGFKGRQAWKANGRTYVLHIVRKLHQLYARGTLRLTAVLFTSLPPHAPPHLTLVQPVPFSSATDFTSALSSMLDCLERSSTSGGDRPATLEALVRGFELLDRKIPGVKPGGQHIKHLILVTPTDMPLPEVNSTLQGYDDWWPVTVAVLNQTQSMDGVSWDDLGGRTERGQDDKPVRIPGLFDKHNVLFGLVALSPAVRLTLFLKRCLNMPPLQNLPFPTMVRPLDRNHVVFIPGLDGIISSPLKRSAAVYQASTAENTPLLTTSPFSGGQINQPSKKTARFDLGSTPASTGGPLFAPTSASAPGPSPLVRLASQQSNTNHEHSAHGMSLSSNPPIQAKPLSALAPTRPGPVIDESNQAQIAKILGAQTIALGRNLPTGAELQNQLKMIKEKATEALQTINAQINRGDLPRDEGTARMYALRNTVLERMTKMENYRVLVEQLWKDYYALNPATSQPSLIAPVANVTTSVQPTTDPQLVRSNSAAPPSATGSQPLPMSVPPAGPVNPMGNKQPIWSGALIWRLPNDPREAKTYVLAMPTQSSSAPAIQILAQTWPKTLRVVAIRPESFQMVVQFATYHRLLGLTIHGITNDNVSRVPNAASAGHPGTPNGNEGGFWRLHQLMSNKHVAIVPTDESGRGFVLIANQQQKNMLCLIFHRMPIPATFADPPAAATLSTNNLGLQQQMMAAEAMRQQQIQHLQQQQQQQQQQNQPPSQINAQQQVGQSQLPTQAPMQGFLPGQSTSETRPDPAILQKMGLMQAQMMQQQQQQQQHQNQSQPALQQAQPNQQNALQLNPQLNPQQHAAFLNMFSRTQQSNPNFAMLQHQLAAAAGVSQASTNNAQAPMNQGIPYPSQGQAGAGAGGASGIAPFHPQMIPNGLSQADLNQYLQFAQPGAFQRQQ